MTSILCVPLKSSCPFPYYDRWGLTHLSLTDNEEVGDEDGEDVSPSVDVTEGIEVGFDNNRSFIPCEWNFIWNFPCDMDRQVEYPLRMEFHVEFPVRYGSSSGISQ